MIIILGITMIFEAESLLLYSSHLVDHVQGALTLKENVSGRTVNRDPSGFALPIRKPFPAAGHSRIRLVG